MKSTIFLTALIGALLMTVSPAMSAESVHPHAKELKNADGSWKYTNKLINESSPYLLQHAHNPVDWYPWGKEAFEKARKEGKPIFLSIGYSTCYWCHVMERLVFENPKIAEQMNKHFVNVKVDREERPDVDDIYMSATQMMNNGGGGWPMSVFLTPPGASGENDPGLKPVFAGTYFPPTRQHGRPAFPEIVVGLSEAWTKQRKAFVQQADSVAKAVTEHLSEQYEPGEVHPATVERTAELMMNSYDSANGGFGRAPKFPTPNNLTFLMRFHQAKPSDEVWNAIEYTLERMARGGMYDQIGGGFHRYSVDARWLVPHFEKMLYDNGQLLEAYLMAQSIQPHRKDNELYTRVAREICEYVLREMVDETGAFWSAQDAEVDAMEGRNYVWTPDQVKAAIKDEKLAALALDMLGLDKGSNFRDPHHPDAKPVNVLYLDRRLDQVAKDHELTKLELLAKREQIRKLMMTVRDKRKQPRTDDKSLTSWNGLMIAGFARAGRDLQEPKYTKAAEKAANYILENMRTENGGLYRTMRNGKVKINGFLEDYAFFVHGLLELYHTTGEGKWLGSAEAFTAHATREFAVYDAQKKPAGGYYDTLADQDDLFVRSRTTYDGATPSGNSVMVQNLITLYEITKSKDYLDQAIGDMQAYAAPLRRRSQGMANMMHAAIRAMALAPNRFPRGDLVARAAQPTLNAPVVALLKDKNINLKEGGKATITLKVHKQFHVNAHEPGVDGLVGVTVDLHGITGITATVQYPKAEKKKFAFADQPIAVYEGESTIEVVLKKTGELGITGQPRLVLGYQACKDDACLAPANITLPISLKGLD